MATENGGGDCSDGGDGGCGGNDGDGLFYVSLFYVLLYGYIYDFIAMAMCYVLCLFCGRNDGDGFVMVIVMVYIYIFVFIIICPTVIAPVAHWRPSVSYCGPGVLRCKPRAGTCAAQVAAGCSTLSE